MTLIESIAIYGIPVIRISVGTAGGGEGAVWIRVSGLGLLASF